MSNILEQTDNFLLGRVFELLQRKFKKLSGKNCFFLAKMMHICNIFMYLTIMIMICFQRLPSFLLIPMELIFFINVLSKVGSISRLKDEEDDFNSLHEKGRMNPTKIKYFNSRKLDIVATILFLPLILYISSKYDLYIIIYILIGYVAFLFHLAGDYFISCNPLASEN